jgi:hypothetical protein
MPSGSWSSVAEHLHSHSVRVDVLPKDRFVMKRLTDAIILALAEDKPLAAVSP